MPTRRYLTPALTFDRAAIMRAAWLRAHALVRSLATAIPSFRRITTARAEFGRCLAAIWQSAKSERALAIWAAERDAAPAVSLSPVEAARLALTIAEHADSFTAHANAAVVAARTRLDAALHLAA